MIYNRNVDQIAASAAVYSVSRVDKKTLFDYSLDSAALGYFGAGLLKSNFQSVHSGQASSETAQEFLDSYGLPLEKFKKTLRTVGVGTNILIKDGEGTNGELNIPMVGRTNTGPDGTVALGKQSRAAGGANGCLSVSGFRELQEEFICARDQEGALTIFNLDYDEDALTKDTKEKILHIKRANMEELLQAYGLNSTDIKFASLRGQILQIKGLTENINQSIDGIVSEVKNRVLKDNPKAGDFAGVDTIVYAQLPMGMKGSQLIIKDGETNFDGDLLKRQWSLASAEEWIEKIGDGMPVSPAPKRVFNN